MVDYTSITERVLDTVGRHRKSDGWCGAGGSSLPHVAAVVGEGTGDHLEIGSLWGASAGAAALAMEQANRPGMVWCIDPMEFGRHEPGVVDPGFLTKPMAESMVGIFWRNMRSLGVEHRVALLRTPSRPWPLGDMSFGTAFIDGWHYGSAPWEDVKNALSRVSTFIMLDDIIEEYASVMSAFYRLCKHPDWFLQYKRDRVAVFRRRKKVAPFSGRKGAYR